MQKCQIVSRKVNQVKYKLDKFIDSESGAMLNKVKSTNSVEYLFSTRVRVRLNNIDTVICTLVNCHSVTT